LSHLEHRVVGLVSTCGLDKESAPTSAPNDFDSKVNKLRALVEGGTRQLNNQERHLNVIGMAIKSIACQQEDGTAIEEHAQPPMGAIRPYTSHLGAVEDSPSAVSLPALSSGDWYPSPDAASSRFDVRPTLSSAERDGEQESIGGIDHPHGCRPCSYYSFSKRGCKKGNDCDFCHKLHTTRRNPLAPQTKSPARGLSSYPVSQQVSSRCPLTQAASQHPQAIWM